MNTEWNFSYDKMSAPTKFNIRPTVSISGLTIWNGTNVIRGFSLSNILKLTVEMRIEILEYPSFSSTRTIQSIDILEKTVTFSGDPLTYGVTPPSSFIFYSNPGVFGDYVSSLTGQQIHDNFFYLSEGLMNHQERLSLVESYSLSVPSEKTGYVKYTGISRTSGSFYGGKALVLLATSDFNTTEVYSPSNPALFSIAMDKGISYPLISNSTFYEVNVGDNLPSDNTFIPLDFCNEVNSRLINDGSEYGFSIYSSQDLSSYVINAPYDTSDWDLVETNSAFYIKIDDADTQEMVKISFTNDNKNELLSGNIDTLIGMLNGKFGSINTKVEAKKMDIMGDVRLLIEGKSTRNISSPGCTRIQILNVGDGSFIENVLYMNNSQSAYDFSTTIQFVPEGNKIKIIGLDPSFKLVLKDDEAIGLLERAGYNPQQFPGNFAVVHSAFPSEVNQTLNFDGNFNSYSVSAYNADLTTINATSLTLTNLTVTGTNEYPSPIKVSFKDLYVENNLKVDNNTSLKFLSVADSSVFEGTVALEGINTVSGEITFNNYTYITNTLHEVDHTLYRETLIVDNNLIPANAPYDTVDGIYLLYNGNFGAYNIDAVGTLAIHGDSKSAGRLYIGSTSPSDSSYTLNYDGNFRATALTGTSSRNSKTDIEESVVDALNILMHTQIVDYKFKTDLETQRIGFIAEDTHTLLSTPAKDGVDITNSIGLIIKAIQELYLLTLKK